MCRMIAFAASGPVDTAPYLAQLARFSRSGNLVARWEERPAGRHPDGWGAASRGGKEMAVVRSGMPAHADPSLRSAATRTDRFIGHVRYASNAATVNAGNAHPFLVGGVAVAHNGTFKGRIGKSAEERKVSDTLVFAEILASAWEERSHPGLADVLSRLLADRELVGEYSAANLLVGCPKCLYALRRFRKDEEYYTLYLRASGDLAVVASEPLDDGPGWRLLENGELVDLTVPGTRSLVLMAPA